jgi:hypothetical protein
MVRSSFSQTGASDDDLEIQKLSDDDLKPDFVRTLLIKTLSKSKGGISLPGLKNVAGNLSTRSLAKAVKDAAVDGIVEIDKEQIYLTPLGEKVAKNQ